MSRSASQGVATEALTPGLRKGLALVIPTFLDPFFLMGGIERSNIAETGGAFARRALSPNKVMKCIQSEQCSARN